MSSKCPNLCFNGKVKHYPNPEKALYELVTCSVCKGKVIDWDKVSKEKIDWLLNYEYYK